MYESTISDASALIAVKRKWEASANLVDPLKSTEASLMKLSDPAPAGGEWSPGELHKALKAYADRVGQDDLSGLETMLVAQAQVLHMLFAQATQKFAANGEQDRNDTYANIALKSQNYCRMTLAAITKMKEVKAKKQRNDVLKEPPFEENRGTNY